MTGSERARRLAGPLAEAGTLALLFALYVDAFYPGSWMSDPIWQYMQVRGLEPLSNWHPPTITLLWMLLDSVFRSHGALFVIQTLLLFGAVHVIARAVAPGLYLRMAVQVVLLLFPPVMGSFGHFWKDDWFALFLMYGYGFLMYLERSRSWSHFALTAVCSALAALTRFNGLFPALPALAYGAWVIAERLGGKRRLRRVGVACAVVLAVVTSTAAASALIDRLYVKKHLSNWYLVPLFDLAGVAVRTGDVHWPECRVPGECGPPPTVAQLSEVFSQDTAASLFWRGDAKYRIVLPGLSSETRPGAGQGAAVVSAWLSGVGAHPREYLAHRAALFRIHVGWRRPFTYQPFAMGIVDNPFGWTYRRSGPNHLVYDRYLVPLADSLLFRVWVYLALIPVLAAVCWWLGMSRSSLALLLSGAMLLGSNFFVLPAADFRYVFWAVLATYCSVVALSIACWRRLRAHSVAKPGASEDPPSTGAGTS